MQCGPGADADTIALLLDQGAGAASKGNGYGDVPLLHLAAHFTADAQVFKALLDRGEDVAARDSNDWTALHMSVRNGNLDPEVIRLLLDAGADVAARAEDGDTPLHHAASHSGAEVVRLLLERGADVNAQDRHLKTPPARRHLRRLPLGGRTPTSPARKSSRCCWKTEPRRMPGMARRELRCIQPLCIDTVMQYCYCWKTAPM